MDKLYLIQNWFAFSEGCNSLTTRNLPASFWNSNYIYPVPAPTHPQVHNNLLFHSIYEFSNFNWFTKFLVDRFPTYIQPTVVIQRIHGFHMQHITDRMRMPLMRTQHKLMHIITIWHSMEVY